MSGQEIMNQGGKSSTKMKDHQFWEAFSTGPNVAAMLWWLIVMESKLVLPVGASPTHMLWSLLFLKTYGKETMLSSMAGGINEKTFWKWA